MKPALLLLALTSMALAQGPLTPPGAPGLTLRSLDEIEPRIPLNQISAPGDATSVYKITRPGSYILTGNIKPPAGHHGILIALLLPGVVEVDMKGFTIDGSDAGPAASALCTNEVIACDFDYYKLGHGTIRGFTGTACLQAPGTCVTLVFQDIIWLKNGAGVSTTGRLLMSDCSITGGTGIPIQMGSNSVLSGVEISGSGATTSPLISTGDHCALERVSLSWSFGGSNSGSAVMLGPDSTISGLTARITGGTFTGPILGNTTGFTEVSGLSIECDGVTAPVGVSNFSWGASNTTLGDTATHEAREAGTGIATGRRISARNCTFTQTVVNYGPDNILIGLLLPAVILEGTTTTPTVCRADGNGLTVAARISIAPTASVTGPVINVSGDGNVVSSSIRGLPSGGTGILISSGRSTRVTGCSIAARNDGAATAIRIAAPVTNALCTNEVFSAFAAGSTMVDNLGGSTNAIAPVLTTTASIAANTNPFASIVR